MRMSYSCKDILTAGFLLTEPQMDSELIGKDWKREIQMTKPTIGKFYSTFHHNYPTKEFEECNDNIDSRREWVNKITSENFRREFPVRATLHHDLDYGSFGPRQVYKSSKFENTTPAKKHSKYKGQIIATIIISCLVVLGAASAVFIVVLRWTHNDNQKQNRLVKAEGQIRIQQEFTEELNDRTSKAYLNFTRGFCEEMKTSMKLDGTMSLENCTVTGLRKGSIIVEFEMLLHTEREISAKILESTFQSSFIKHANGLEYFGKYPVKSASLSISIITPFRINTAATKTPNTVTLIISTIRTLTRDATAFVTPIVNLNATTFPVLPSSPASHAMSTTSNSSTPLFTTIFPSNTAFSRTATAFSSTTSSSTRASFLTTISRKISFTNMSSPVSISTTVTRSTANSSSTLTIPTSNSIPSTIPTDNRTLTTVPEEDTTITTIPTKATHISNIASSWEKTPMLLTTIHVPRTAISSATSHSTIASIFLTTISPKISLTNMSSPASISTTVTKAAANSNSTIETDAINSSSISMAIPTTTHAVTTVLNEGTLTTIIPTDDTSTSKTIPSWDRTSVLSTTILAPPTPVPQETPHLRANLTSSPKIPTIVTQTNTTLTTLSSIATTITTSTSTLNTTLQSPEAHITTHTAATDRKTSWKDSKSSLKTKQAVTKIAPFPVPPLPPQQLNPPLKAQFTKNATTNLNSQFSKSTYTSTINDTTPATG